MFQYSAIMKTSYCFFVTILLGFVIINSCVKDEENPIVKDIDGNVYHTVRIGHQVWMAENLKTTRYNDGAEIPLVEDIDSWSVLTEPGFCFYNNDSLTNHFLNREVYGALYNWNTINSKKLCPAGWHIPSDDEWKSLEIYLGLTRTEADSTGWRGTGQGKLLMALFDWAIDTTGCWSDSLLLYPSDTHVRSVTNSTGFTALPGGIRNSDGTFSDIRNRGNWWSSTKEGSNTAIVRSLKYNSNNIYRLNLDTRLGCSVRCVKD